MARQLLVREMLCENIFAVDCTCLVMHLLSNGQSGKRYPDWLCTSALFCSLLSLFKTLESQLKQPSRGSVACRVDRATLTFPQSCSCSCCRRWTPCWPAGSSCSASPRPGPSLCYAGWCCATSFLLLLSERPRQKEREGEIINKGASSTKELCDRVLTGDCGLLSA